MKYLITAGLISTALCSLPAFADITTGEQLVNTQCQQCHDNGVFTRPNSIIHSLPELQARVEFCESNSGRHWSEQQIADVVAYLNQKYYKFPAN